MIKRIVFILFSFLFCQILFCQINETKMSTIYFLNGDTLQVVVEEKNEWNITIIKSQKKDKTKHKIINNDQILMITNDKGEKDFVYKHDPSKGNFMEKKEMEQYVKGRIKAKYFYTPKIPFFSSFLFGVTIGLIDTYNFRDPKYDIGLLNHPAGLISLSAPLLSASIFGNNRISFNDRKTKSDEEMLNESFVHGYAIEKKSKISRATFRGSVIGVISVILIQIFSN